MQYFLNECWRGIVEDKQLQRDMQGGAGSNAGGVLCASYTNLMQQLWMGDKPVVRPHGKQPHVVYALHIQLIEHCIQDFIKLSQK